MAKAGVAAVDKQATSNLTRWRKTPGRSVQIGNPEPIHVSE